MRTILARLVACVLIFCAMRTAAGERASFLAAEEAFEQGDLARFHVLEAESRGHPLHPYLRFAELKAALDSGVFDPEAIQAFLNDEPEAQLAVRLRAAYLEHLAAAGRWSEYARLDRPHESPVRRCRHLRALIESGRQDEAWPQVPPVWLSGPLLPEDCSPVFERWRASGRMTGEHLWARIRQAMEARQQGLARKLAAWLPSGEQAWLERWTDVDRSPALVTDMGRFEQFHPQRAAILAHGIVGLARRSPSLAADVFERRLDALRTDEAALDRAAAAVGRALARRDSPRGFVIWDKLSAREDNLADQEVRLRAAITASAWSWVVQWIGRMPDSDAKSDRWLYWLARAEEALGRKEAARVTYEQAARRRSFWGFLAAGYLGVPVDLDDRPTPAEPERIRRLVMTPAYGRIQELRQLGRETDLRREWRALTAQMEKPDLMAAAYIADVLGWHDQAVLLLVRTGYWDDISLRFPLAHRERVLEEGARTGLDPAWIYAIIRQESIFARDAVSSAGAVGLMQLMPSTAADVAATLGMAEPSRRELIDPGHNIALGSAYLARMRDRFGHPALATAAYNAGPARVQRWLPEREMPLDLWVLQIPFPETRGYVERVMAYRLIYAERLGVSRVRLDDLLPPVPARGS